LTTLTEKDMKRTWRAKLPSQTSLMTLIDHPQNVPMWSADFGEWLDRAKAGRDDADHPPMCVAGEERRRRRELDDAPG
jgi:hypothetical protein